MDTSNNRRGFFQTRDLCEKYGGKIPYSYENSVPSQTVGDEWHWLNYPAVDNTCLAIRPGRYQDGAAYFPCGYKFKIACEKNTISPLPVPAYPDIVRLNNPQRYKYNYLPCSRSTFNCKGKWVAAQVISKGAIYSLLNTGAQDDPRRVLGFGNNRRDFGQGNQNRRINDY